MRNMNRRALIVALMSTTALAACQTTQGNQLIQQVVTDVGLIASGLQGALPGLLTALGVSNASIGSDVSQYIADLQNAAGTVGSINTAVAAQPIVQQVESYLNGIVGVLAVLPVIPPPFSTALQAAMILLPVIEAAVNLIVNPTVSASRVDTARLTLRSYAVRKK